MSALNKTSHTNSKQRKISALIILTSLFFVCELVGGYITKSIALIADSFHMLSDVASLIIALVASKLAKSNRFSSDLSYGLQRAEVLGALINGVGLLALCFTLFISAIQRLVEPEVIENPHIVLYVASAGLAVNVVGLLLFHDHSHAVHSHHHFQVVGNSGDDLMANDDENPYNMRSKVIGAAEHLLESKSHIEKRKDKDHVCDNTCEEGYGVDEEQRLEIDKFDKFDENDTAIDALEGHSHGGHTHDLNMHGVFLHVLGDLLASVGVIVSSLLIIFFDNSWTKYVDPTMSLIITFIIIHASLPLVKSACFILLQGTPSTVSIELLRKDILQVKGVLDVHELHVWQLSDTQTIASVHIVVPHPAKDGQELMMEDWYMELAGEIKKKLHKHGIHSTTVQPEFLKSKVEKTESSKSELCMLRCSSKECETKTCCPTD